MGALVPNPVTLEDLINEASNINTFNNGVLAQAVSPRTNGTETIIVAVKDDVLAPVFKTGTCDANVLNSVVDTSENFVTDGVEVGDFVVADATGLSAVVTAITTTTNPNDTLTLDADICPAGTEAYTIRKPSYWVQKATDGEWVASGARTGNDKSASYTLPVNTATTTVHDVIYPIDLADIATYPPIVSA